MIGSLIASAINVHDLGEYGGFYLTYYVAPLVYQRLPSTVSDGYLESARRHALTYAAERARAAGCAFFLDSTPWNLLVLRDILAEQPDAVVVLVLRHYAGVIQSLARSYRDGYAWAGATVADRAKLWRSHYAQATGLDARRVIAFGYDHFATDPQRALSQLRLQLREEGVDADSIEVRRLAISAATNRSDHRPVAFAGGLRPFPSFDAAGWTDDLAAAAAPIVKGVDTRLRGLFTQYVEPHDHKKRVT
jgi:Sulfotransferase family